MSHEHQPATPCNGSPDTCCQSVDQHEQAEMNRRSFLRRTFGALLGLSVGGPILSLMDSPFATGLSTVQAAANLSALGDFPEVSPSPLKSVIVLWMNGGASQMDTFDPKPGTRNGGPTKGISTAIPNVQISEFLPRTASILDRFAVLRSMVTKEGNHNRARSLMRTGFTPNPTVEYPGLGAILNYEQQDPYSKLPQNISINQPGERAGILGIPYEPFYVPNAQQKVQNLELPKNLSEQRLQRRLHMMQAHDSEFRAQIGEDAYLVDGHHEMFANALELMKAEEKTAFFLDDEPAAVKDAYGKSRFGQGCLMARRLVERGVKFVEVSLNGWDTHQDNYNKCGELCSDLDAGLHALVTDLEQRDLLQSTLVVWMGEFGRTPEINNNEGRDHYPNGWSVALAGAHIKGGTVLGETPANGDRGIIGRGIPTADLYRTLLWSAGVKADTLYYAPNGRPVTYADEGQIIREILKG